MATNTNKLLDYYSKLTPEQRREQCAKGGRAGAAAKQQYRKQADLLRQMLATDIQGDADLTAELQALGLPTTYGSAVAFRQLIRSIQSGDVESAKYVRDTVGEKPTEKQSISVEERIADGDLASISTEELLRMVADADN